MVRKVGRWSYLRLSLETIVQKFDGVFKVWFFERFAKPNRPKNMGASLGFFGLVRPLLLLLSRDRLRVAWNDSEYEIELQVGLVTVAVTAR